MAGAAAAAIAAEQVVATGVQAAAAVAIATPTLPLKISLTQLTIPIPSSSPHPALARSHHTLTILANKAFIFGGEDASGKLCPPAIHTLTLPTSKTTPDPATAAASASEDGSAYTCYPPYTLRDASTGDWLLPRARAEHAACALGGDRFLLVHGGRGGDGGDGGAQPLDEDNCTWQWDSEQLRWSKLRGDTQLGARMAPRWGHWIFADDAQRFVVLVGGRGVEREAWMYDLGAGAWTALPEVPARPVAAAYAGGRVYVVSRAGEGGADLGGAVHFLDMRESETERQKAGALVWETVEFPANPLAPGPRPREGGALVPLATGYGREYLVYMFGRSDDEGGEKFYSDIWTLQLPSQGRSLAAAKDKVRDKLPSTESEEFRWAEVEIVPTEQVVEEGKVHPGPRALFGADRCLDGHGVALWGGTNAKGEKESDGWLLRLAHGYADHDRLE